MPRSFAGSTSETHRPVAPRPSPPDRMVLHVSPSTRATAPPGLAHTGDVRHLLKTERETPVHLVSGGMKAARGQTRTRRWSTRHPRRATADDEVTRLCDRWRAGLRSVGWLHTAPRGTAWGAGKVVYGTGLSLCGARGEGGSQGKAWQGTCRTYHRGGEASRWTEWTCGRRCQASCPGFLREGSRARPGWAATRCGAVHIVHRRKNKPRRERPVWPAGCPWWWAKGRALGIRCGRAGGSAMSTCVDRWLGSARVKGSSLRIASIASTRQERKKAKVHSLVKSNGMYIRFAIFWRKRCHPNQRH